MLLARKGYRVLLLDRDAFPSDVMSTHFVQQAGTARLQHWGLLDQVRESNCPPVTRMCFDFGGLRLEGSPPPAGDVKEAFAPRRRVLDEILVDAAVAAGAELRERFAVRELVFGDDGRVTGIRGASRGAPEVVESARIVIGADGLHSLVARTVQAQVTKEHPVVSCGYYSYWSGVKVDAFEVHPRDGWAVAGFPTNDGLTCLIVGAAIKHFDAFRSDVEKTYTQAFAIAPSLAERMLGAKREERILGSGEFVNQFRKPYGPGWALVGDAGYHKDPSTAQGISDAFRDAELLAEALDEGFSSRSPLEEALANYEKERDMAAGPMFDFTCQMAALEPPSPDMQQLIGALSHSQAHTNEFLGLLAGTVSIPEFFSEANMGRIFAAAAV
jgi:flavin-dependent dehydrogenase